MLPPNFVEAVFTVTSDKTLNAWSWSTLGAWSKIVQVISKSTRGQRGTYCAPDYNVPPLLMDQLVGGQHSHLGFQIGKKTDFVEDKDFASCKVLLNSVQQLEGFENVSIRGQVGHLGFPIHPKKTQTW